MVVIEAGSVWLEIVPVVVALDVESVFLGTVLGVLVIKVDGAATAAVWQPQILEGSFGQGQFGLAPSNGVYPRPMQIFLSRQMHGCLS